MLRKMSSVLLVAFVGLLAFGGVAGAAPGYRPPVVVINVFVNVNINITIVNNGVIFFGSGFDPGEGISVSVSYASPSGLRSSKGLTEMAKAKDMMATAAADGSFSTAVTLTRAGTATLTATGLTSGKVASQTVTVLGTGATIPNNAAASNNSASGLDSGGSSNSITGVGGTGGTDVGAGSAGSDGTGGAANSSAESLAFTGTSVAGPIAIGLAALLAGLTFLFFGTRGVIRRKSSRTSPIG